MNFINLYENGDNFNYGNYISKGYSSYYTEKYNNNWVKFYTSMDINKISLKSLVLFYLRWEKDNDKLDKLIETMHDCIDRIKNNENTELVEIIKLYC